MTIETGIQVFAIIHLGTLGISHVIAHKTWARFFIWLREKEGPGVFCIAFLSLGIGSVIVAFHPVWAGIPIVLTVFGWSQVLKAVVYFSFPSVGLKKLSVVSIEKSRVFIFPGVFMIILALLLVWHLI